MNNLLGSGFLAFSLNSIPFILSPKYVGNSFPSLISTGELLGLENCPAILPTLTTGKDAEKVKTKAICKITLKVSLMLSG